MEKEENVYVENIQAEEKSSDRKDEKLAGASNNASAVPEKFKDVDALARAYGSLQAEFTRRSQKLKELERIAENFKSGEEDAEGSGVEKLRKVATARRFAAKEFDRFVAELCAAQKTGDTPTEEKPARVKALEKPSVEGTEVRQEGEAAQGAESLEIAERTSTVMGLNDSKNLQAANGRMASVAPNMQTQERESVGDFTGSEKRLASKDALLKQEAWGSVAGNGKDGEESEDLYARVSRDENVRLRIIGEYLSSIGKSGAPLTTGGVGVMTTPPMRAKNIGEAGVMALQYFKKPVVCD